MFQIIARESRQWAAGRAATVVLAVSALLTTGVSAELLGISISDPALVFDNQGTTQYTASSDRFSVATSPLAIRLPSGLEPIGE